MAKLKAPLLSFFATGNLAKILAFRRRGSTTVAEAYPFPTDRKSTEQLTWRTVFQMAIDWWHQLSSAEHTEWEALARPRHMTGYALFLSTALKPNPGIYLPLIGGAMKGDIDMANHALSNQKAYASRAFLSNSQVIPTDTWHIVQLNTDTFDYQGEFDPVNHRYIAAVPGLRGCIGMCTYSDIADQVRFYSGIFLNGIEYNTNFINQSASGVDLARVITSDYVDMDTNDYLDLRAFHRHGSDRNLIAGTSRTFLGVYTLCHA